jgi:hypothetical protein
MTAVVEADDRPHTTDHDRPSGDLDPGTRAGRLSSRPLDDIVVVARALRYAAHRVPPDALLDAWPAERRILEHLAPSLKGYSDETVT